MVAVMKHKPRYLLSWLLRKKGNRIMDYEIVNVIKGRSSSLRSDIPTISLILGPRYSGKTSFSKYLLTKQLADGKSNFFTKIISVHDLEASEDYKKNNKYKGVSIENYLLMYISNNCSNYSNLIIDCDLSEKDISWMITNIIINKVDRKFNFVGYVMLSTTVDMYSCCFDNKSTNDVKEYVNTWSN